MAQLVERVEDVFFESFKGQQLGPFALARIDGAEAQLGLPALVVLEQSAAGGPRPSEGGVLYWPQIARRFALAWGSFLCVEKERCSTADGPAGAWIVELVRFEAALRTAALPTESGPELRAFAMPLSGSPKVRSSQPVPPYVAWVMHRAGYAMPSEYLAGQQPPRSDDTTLPPVR